MLTQWWPFWLRWVENVNKRIHFYLSSWWSKSSNTMNPPHTHFTFLSPKILSHFITFSWLLGKSVLSTNIGKQVLSCLHITSPDCAHSSKPMYCKYNQPLWLWESLSFLLAVASALIKYTVSYWLWVSLPVSP